MLLNVLLAEANVAYEHLVEMEHINPELPQADIVLVVGANDVTNPAAKTNKSSPLFGMPILEVSRAKSIIVLKRSMRPGFAGVDNDLYCNRYPGSPGRRHSGIDGGVVAVEIAEALQVEDLAGGLDRRDADVTDGDPLHGDRVLLALVRQGAPTPVDADARGDGSATQLDRRARRGVLCECGREGEPERGHRYESCNPFHPFSLLPASLRFSNSARVR